MNTSPIDPDDKPLDAATGCTFGVILGVICWVAVFVILHFAKRGGW